MCCCDGRCPEEKTTCEDTSEACSALVLCLKNGKEGSASVVGGCCEERSRPARTERTVVRSIDFVGMPKHKYECGRKEERDAG